MDHVVIRKLEHLTGSAQKPDLGYAIETRDRPGPAHKKGAFSDDRVWIQLHGGLYVGKAHVEICWIGEYATVSEIRARTRGSAIHDVDDFWRGRPKFGYAAVATLIHESWIDPFWAGPRTYGYEWVLLDNEKKQSSWMAKKEAPRTGDDLLAKFKEWRG
jgi:hypothetical protein